MGLNLDWPKVNNTFGQLSLPNARNWDAIVAAADQAGIHFQMTLQHHGQYSSTNISKIDPNWEQNPYNTANGGFLSSRDKFLHRCRTAQVVDQAQTSLHRGALGLFAFHHGV